jgi:REP element-mobilizing transposase RayT
MILATHVVFGAYGFWLPNDPRGSGSDYVWSKPLQRFGPATKIRDRQRSRASVPHDRALRLAAKAALKYPAVQFTGIQARAVARGFARACAESGYIVHACSILPEHVHLVIARNERWITRIAGHLKARATQQLKAEARWPDEGRPVWADGGWKVYLDSDEEVLDRIGYVEKNPLKEGKQQQRWDFVVPYVGGEQARLRNGPPRQA